MARNNKEYLFSRADGSAVSVQAKDWESAIKKMNSYIINETVLSDPFIRIELREVYEARLTAEGYLTK